MDHPSKLSITDFLSEVHPNYVDFVSQTHELLTKANHKSKFDTRRYGITAQYTSPITKRLALQFFIRDGILSMYLYSGFIYCYDHLFDTLPSYVFKALEANNDCRDCGAGCNNNICTMNGKQYRKCFNGRTLFTVTEEVTNILSILQKICE